jgi:Rad3-related DNA helicase
MRSRIADCDLAILPYNYLIDKNLRDQIDLPLKDAVLIFDEGHNIESFCEELYTFELSVNDLFQMYQQLNSIWLQLQTEEQVHMLNEHQRYAIRGQRVDTKAMCLLILKMVDVVESYNVEKWENKVKINNLPPNMNVFRLPELFQLIAMVFGKLKDEKDMMLDRMKKNRIKVGDGNLCKLNDTNGVLDHEGEFSFIEKLEMFI